jgi:hypothetical protein
MQHHFTLFQHQEVVGGVDPTTKKMKGLPCADGWLTGC